MTDQEKADMQELLDALPRCETYGGEGPNGWVDWREQCNETAMMLHPTAVIGDWVFKCTKHPGETENEFGDTAHPTRWAPVVARLVAQGFRSSR